MEETPPTWPTVAWQRVVRMYDTRSGAWARALAGPSSVEVRDSEPLSQRAPPCCFSLYPQALRKIHTGCLVRSASDTCCDSVWLPAAPSLSSLLSLLLPLFSSPATSSVPGPLGPFLLHPLTVVCMLLYDGRQPILGCPRSRAQTRRKNLTTLLERLLIPYCTYLHIIGPKLQICSFSEKSVVYFRILFLLPHKRSFDVVTILNVFKMT